MKVTATLLYIRGVCNLRFFQSQWIIERSMAFFVFGLILLSFPIMLLLDIPKKLPISPRNRELLALQNAQNTGKAHGDKAPVRGLLPLLLTVRLSCFEVIWLAEDSNLGQ